MLPPSSFKEATCCLRPPSRSRLAGSVPFKEELVPPSYSRAQLAVPVLLESLAARRGGACMAALQRRARQAERREAGKGEFRRYPALAGCRLKAALLPSYSRKPACWLPSY